MGVRFAPSPTGRFHVGNLRTAWISGFLARRFALPWIVRFEDIDTLRVLAGARDEQLADLERLGLRPDRVVVQSELRERHWRLFVDAVREGQVYPCFCSRKEVREALERMASAPHREELVYSGRCRALGSAPTAHGLPTLGWRFKWEPASGERDFIVARSAPALDASGLPDEASFAPAYHWACAIDDDDGAYSLLVRAADLAPALEQQRAIQRWLAGRECRDPRFAAVFHTALVTRDDGERLEKRTKGVTLPELTAAGWSEAGIVERFARSFGWDRGPWSPGEVMGEAREQITLSELGL